MFWDLRSPPGRQSWRVGTVPGRRVRVPIPRSIATAWHMHRTRLKVFTRRLRGRFYYDESFMVALFNHNYLIQTARDGAPFEKSAISNRVLLPINAFSYMCWTVDDTPNANRFNACTLDAFGSRESVIREMTMNDTV